MCVCVCVCVCVSQIVAFVVLVNAVPLVQFAVQYIRLGAVQKSTPSSTISSIISLLVFGTQPTGELILLSVYAYVVFYIYLPPATQQAHTLMGFRCVCLLFSWVAVVVVLPLIGVGPTEQV